MNFKASIESCFRSVPIAAFLLLPIVLSTAVAPAAAQSTATVALSGVVVDSAGKPLGDARVTIASASFTRVLRTDGAGRFTLPVPADTYTITVSISGFETVRQDGVNVVPGRPANLQFALSNATLQTIGRTSGGGATSINTSSAATTIVSGQTFADQGQPQVTNVLDQIPGVEISHVSSNAPGSNTSISLRGAQPYESQILLDGHPVVTSANGAGGFNGTFINALLLSDVEVSLGPGNLPNTIEDAVGGTLNFRTPTITGGPTGNAIIGYDSYDSFYYTARASDTFGKLGILVGIAEYDTPGYLAPGTTIYGGATYPAVGPGTAYNPHVGVLDFGYPGSQAFTSHNQLAKVSYNFSPVTTITLEQYSTQSTADESGTNDQYVNATIVPCIDTPPAGYVGTPNCTEGGTNPNYTSTPNLGKVGQVEPINLYAPYPNTSEFDNEPIYSGEFRTVVGPGSLLARYYTGVIDRVITQNYAPNADIPCSSPACPTGDNLTVKPPIYGAYQGEPYVEDTIDILHGFDAQYTIPFAADYVTFGFDRHVDSATFGEYDPTEGPPSFDQNLPVQSLSYSIRGSIQLTPKLTLESGNYLSSTSYVGTRFDPRDGLIYKVNPTAAIRVSYGSAYVAPYYNILNPSSYVSSGTLNLATTNFKPETSSGYDVGTDFNLTRNTLISVDGFLTNIFNRYDTVTTETAGTFAGTPYTMVTQNINQALVREEGIELQVKYAPRVGLGYHGALDMLRDYAYDQNAAVTVDSSSLFSAEPANYVQLPGYPYTKIRNDLYYTFGNSAQVRASATSYGANNAYGEPGFTEWDGEIRLPLQHEFVLNIGGTNLFNHDNYQAGGIYDGGPTFEALGGGNSYTTRFFVQPRTFFLELQRSVGPGGNSQLPRTSL